MGKITKAARAVEDYIEKETAGLTDDKLLEWLGIDRDTPGRNINEITYFTCLKMLSETMGKLPLKYLKEENGGKIRAPLTPMARILTIRPNQFLTPTAFWTALEMNAQHTGNGFAWIRGRYNLERYGGTWAPLDAWVLPSASVSVIMDDAGIFGDSGELYYQFGDPDTGKIYIFRRHEILHFKTWFSFDGVIGRPVSEILKYTIDGNLKGQEFLNNLYKQGVTARYAMQYTGDLDDDRRKRLQTSFADQLSGAKNAGRVIPVPKSLTLTPLQGTTLADSQYMELRKYSALQIAAAFGIKPNQLNDYEKSSYANSEMQQLAFLVDTMLYRIKVYEEEINAICLTDQEQRDGYMYKFNEKALLRTDSETQIRLMSQAVNNGIYTPNEARGFIDLPAKEGGDVLIVNGNYIPITKVGSQYDKGGEN